mgnify:CR=1 FL=1
MNWIRKKYRKCGEEVAMDVSKVTDTAILRIDLISTSKLTGYFIYDTCYLDEGQLKQVPIVARDITDVIRQLEPYVRKGISEQWTQFQLGSEKAIESRKQQKEKKKNV